MRPSLIIPRLREQCPVFSGRVAGAIDYRRAIESDDFAVPHAFVLLAAIAPDGDEQISTLDQEVSCQLSVMLAVAADADVTGQDASQQLFSCFVQIRSALLGWTPDATLYTPFAMDGLMLADGEATFLRARAWAQCDITASAMARGIA